MVSPVIVAVVYSACGIWAAVLWGYIYRRQIAARRISISSLFALIAIESLAFFVVGAFLRWRGKIKPLKYSLQTLLIAAILGPAVLAGMYYLLPRTYDDFSGIRRYGWDEDQKRILFVAAVILALGGLGLLIHFSRLKQP